MGRIWDSPKSNDRDLLAESDHSLRSYLPLSIFALGSMGISKMFISKATWTILIKFHVYHQWEGGKTAKGFWADLIGTLVAMATYISHRLNMRKTLSSL